jgi:oligosaccharide repeat unit polymerase
MLLKYLVASIPAFDQYSQSTEDYGLGLNIFRTVFVVLTKLGIDVNAPELIREFQYVPMPTNVYTVYQPYYADFSWIGLIVIQFFLGFWHGILFRETNNKNTFYAVPYVLFLYPLFMQFFQDQYFSLLSVWIQYGLLFFLYFLINQSKRKDRVVRA